jgi:predicted O-methyltransferase YrrM
MNNIDVKKIVGDTPHMSLAEADLLTAFMEKYQVKNILELGFAHGVSTSYMAAALSRSGGGSVVTIDKEEARKRKPNIETFLARIGESDCVKIYYEPTSYNWRLMKFLEQDPRPEFDLCYLDGAHNWFVDGFAFFLVHLLLKPGGWIIFDDLNWSYAISPCLNKTEWVKNIPEDERVIPQVRKIYELLVKLHPDFCNFMIDGNWAYAQKLINEEDHPSKREIIVEQVVHREYYGFGHFLSKVAKKVLK